MGEGRRKREDGSKKRGDTENMGKACCYRDAEGAGIACYCCLTGPFSNLGGSSGAFGNQSQSQQLKIVFPGIFIGRLKGFQPDMIEIRRAHEDKPNQDGQTQGDQAVPDSGRHDSARLPTIRAVEIRPQIIRKTPFVPAVGRQTSLPLRPARDRFG